MWRFSWVWWEILNSEGSSQSGFCSFRLSQWLEWLYLEFILCFIFVESQWIVPTVQLKSMPLFFTQLILKEKVGLDHINYHFIAILLFVDTCKINGTSEITTNNNDLTTPNNIFIWELVLLFLSIALVATAILLPKMKTDVSHQFSFILLTTQNNMTNHNRLLR